MHWRFLCHSSKAQIEPYRGEKKIKGGGDWRGGEGTRAVGWVSSYA